MPGHRLALQALDGMPARSRWGTEPVPASVEVDQLTGSRYLFDGGIGK